ncbi:MAG TPA: TolC family protein, partial [Pyrinomonadaceae bacterium]|nr:TolC family protein [Pyrinomonadaceae bacterium]
LSVEQAVTLALENAATLRLAQFDELSAEQDVKQARAAMLPQFSMPLTYWGTTPSTVRAPDEPLTFSFVSASAINESIGALSTTGTIDVAGKLRAGLRRARALLVAAHAGTLAARRGLALETIDAYYGLVLARQKRRLADETLALAANFVAVTEEQLKLGLAAESDVLRARSAAHSRRDELSQTQLAESAAMSQLRVLTGIDYKTHIAVVRLTENVPQIGDFLSYHEDLVLTRPELTQLDAQRRAAFEDASAARRELRPQLTYTLNGGFDAANFKPLGRYSGGAAIVTLNIPIFNFGASKSRETQALLRAKSLDAQRDVAVRGLKQEFYAARAGALSALDRIKEADQAALAAQENLSLVYAGYREQKATLLEVIDAQSNFSSTRNEFYQAIADYHSARARLEVDPTEMFRRVNPPAVVGTKPAACALTRDQAPDIGGLRLGMTLAQVKTLISSVSLNSVNEDGVSQAEVKSSAINQMPTSSFFEGAERINLEFVDGKLSFVRVAYPPTNKWSSKDEFLSTLAPKFQLRGQWEPFYDWQTKDARDAQDLRDLAIECEGFRLSAGIGIEGLGGDQTPHYELDDMVAARLVKERKAERSRREQPKPKQ